MHITIFGANGFIGRRLVQILMEDEENHLQIVSRKKIANTQLHPRLDHIICDIEFASVQFIKNFIHENSVVINCAGEIHDFRKMYAVNAHGSFKIAKACAETKSKLIHLSSTGVYGFERKSESSNSCFLNEKTPLNPSNFYELTKAIGDKAIEELTYSCNLKSIIVRPSVVFGNDMPGRSLYSLIESIYNNRFFHIDNGKGIGNYIHVYDLAQSIKCLISFNTINNYNEFIVSEYIEFNEIAKIIYETLGKKNKMYNFPKWIASLIVILGKPLPNFPLTKSRLNAFTNQIIFDTQKLYTGINWKPEFGIRQGFADLTKNFKIIKGIEN